MWEKIFTEDTLEHIIGATDETRETEDFSTMKGFIDHIIARVNYKIVVILATQWETFEDTKQAKIAIEVAGVFHASRFIMLMDYLAKRFKEGNLK